MIDPRADQPSVRAMLHSQRAYGSGSPQLTEVRGGWLGVATSGTSSATSNFARRGHSVLVADARLDNREELLDYVGEPAAASDAELLLAVWLKGGEPGLARVSGDFAIAIFDMESGQLTLVRDVTGQMPLHYARTGSGVAFASMPTALIPFVGQRSINREAVARFLCDARDDDSQSYFGQINRLLPGEIIRLGPGEPRSRTYWTPRTDPLEGRDQDDLIAEYRNVLDQAVHDRLKGSSRPVASHLSSGWDSSAVTATAARQLLTPDQLIAFTAAPSSDASIPEEMWRIGDESAIARRTASELGIRHVTVRDLPDVTSVISRQSLLVQEPTISVFNAAWAVQIRRQAAQSGANCLLSGDCGNASLNAGGLPVLSEWLRRGRLPTWARQARYAAKRPDTHWRGVLFNSFRPWLPTRVEDTLVSRYMGTLSDASFLRDEWRAIALRDFKHIRHESSYVERLHIIRNGNVAMLRKAGLAGEGIDERDPMADRRLIEFSLRLPPEQLYWNGVSRPLARAALSDRVPRFVLDLKWRGLQSADWAMRITPREAHSLLEEISPSSTAGDLFDLDRMRQAIDNWPKDASNDRSVHFKYRVALIGALSCGMFIRLHEKAEKIPAA